VPCGVPSRQAAASAFHATARPLALARPCALMASPLMVSRSERPLVVPARTACRERLEEQRAAGRRRDARDGRRRGVALGVAVAALLAGGLVDVAVSATGQRAIGVASRRVDAALVAVLAGRLVDVAVAAHGQRAVRIARRGVDPARVALLAGIDAAVAAGRA